MEHSWKECGMRLKQPTNEIRLKGCDTQTFKNINNNFFIY